MSSYLFISQKEKTSPPNPEASSKPEPSSKPTSSSPRPDSLPTAHLEKEEESASNFYIKVKCFFCCVFWNFMDSRG